jgi:YihY family inner membrane protein
MPGTSKAVDLLLRFSRTGSYAAEMAFYLALSLVPFLGLTAVAAVTWLPSDVGAPLANTLIRVFAPEAGLDATVISTWVRSFHGSGWLAAGMLLAAYSAFRFMSACVRALASLGGVEPRDLRHRLQSAASAAFLVVVWMVVLLLLSFVILIASPLEETLEETILAHPAVTAATLSRVMAGVVLLLAIALTYRAIPRLQARGWRLWAMAALATLGWVAAGWAVTRVLPSLWQAEALYGALASFVLFLLWSYANAWVLLVCGQLAGRSPAH